MTKLETEACKLGLGVVFYCRFEGRPQKGVNEFACLKFPWMLCGDWIVGNHKENVGGA